MFFKDLTKRLTLNEMSGNTKFLKGVRLILGLTRCYCESTKYLYILQACMSKVSLMTLKAQNRSCADLIVTHSPVDMESWPLNFECRVQVEY